MRKVIIISMILTLCMHVPVFANIGGDEKSLTKRDFVVETEKECELLQYDNDVLTFMDSVLGDTSGYYFNQSDDYVEDEDLTGKVTLSRNIVLGESKKSDLLDAYGIGVSAVFDSNKDLVYKYGYYLDKDEAYFNLMKDRLKETIFYNYKDLYQIVFFIDNTDTIRIVYFLNTIQYTADSVVIKYVQETLNSLGFNCGTPDGIMGNNTKNAIISYQKDRGMFESGIIDNELLNSLDKQNNGNGNQQSLGISISDFVKRYNEATDYYNAIASRDGYNKANYITEEMAKSSDSFSPNQNMKLCVNPNTTNKDMIGIINAWAEDSALIDANVGTGEIMAMIYAFDPNMEDGGDALQMWSRLHNENTEISENGITYDNYSFGNMVTLKAQYDGFEITK